MRVLHYVDEKNLAWGESWIQLLSELADQGVSNHVVCRRGGTLELRLKDADISYSVSRPLMQLLPFTNCRFGKIINDFKPDIIHTRLSSAAGIGGWWGNRRHIPVLQTIDKYPKLKYYKMGSFYAACSRSVMEYFITLGISKNSIKVIHNPVDVNKYSRNIAIRRYERQSHAVSSESTKVVLGAGRFVAWKGFDILIKGYEKFLTENPDSDSVLWIVGGGEEKENLTTLAERSQFRGRIKIMPFASDIRPYMQAADLFVLPSKEPEPFGIVLLEAMASSLPVIATEAGGPLDIVTDDSGWFCNANDEAALAQRIKEALANDDVLSRMSLKARERAGYFNLHRIAGETIELYRALAPIH